MDSFLTLESRGQSLTHLATSTATDPTNAEGISTSSHSPQIHFSNDTSPPKTPPTLSHRANQLLTPPITPEKPVSKLALPRTNASSFYQTDDSENLVESVQRGDEEDGQNTAEAHSCHAHRNSTPRIYHKSFQTDKELGHGVWSTVYSATEVPSTPPSHHHHNISTPPPTPPSKGSNSSSSTTTTSKSRPQRAAAVLAVKLPSRRDAHPILEHEARILTYLSSHRAAHDHIVPFHGYDPARHAIVMTAAPLTLHALIAMRKKNSTSPQRQQQQQQQQQGNNKHAAMSDPFLGRDTWMRLAQQLIEGLAFLHDCGCAHGDIKPANILVVSDDSSKISGSGSGNSDTSAETLATSDDIDTECTPLKFLYCDFSSAQLTAPNTTTTTTTTNSSPSTTSPPPTLTTAVTPDYSAPELLSYLRHHPSPSPHSPSRSSPSSSPSTPPAPAQEPIDIFALGTTLLEAGIGALPYSGAQLELQKLAMAREGTPLVFAQGGGMTGSAVLAARCRRGGMVERVVKPAVEKRVDVRIGVGGWRRLVGEIAGGEVI